MQLKASKLNLQQHAVISGYRTQRALLSALEARGLPIPQSVLSGMYRGHPAYRKARENLARFFWPEEWARENGREWCLERVATLIANGAK